MIVLGALFLLDNLGFADFGDVMSTYWPVILIIVGLSMLWRNRVVVKKKTNDGAVNPDASSWIDHTNVFGDISLEVTSQSFKGGGVSTVFGDVTVDLTRAALADGEQVLKVSGVFGDVDVKLPRDVAHCVSGATLFGELRIADQRKGGIAQQAYYVSDGYDRSAKRLRIDCSQVFGDLRVTSQPVSS